VASAVISQHHGRGSGATHEFGRRGNEQIRRVCFGIAQFTSPARHEHGKLSGFEFQALQERAALGRIGRREQRIEVPDDVVRGQPQFEALEQAQAARDELWKYDPVLVEQAQPGDAKCFPAQTRRAAREHQPRPGDLGGTQLHRAPRIVEYHDRRPHALDRGEHLRRTACRRVIALVDRKLDRLAEDGVATDEKMAFDLRVGAAQCPRNDQATHQLAGAMRSGHRHEQHPRRCLMVGWLLHRHRERTLCSVANELATGRAPDWPDWPDWQ
jgi:hypothetical protein